MLLGGRSVRIADDEREVVALGSILHGEGDRSVFGRREVLNISEEGFFVDRVGDDGNAEAFDILERCRRRWP